MKKEKKIRTYQRRTKSGKTITVRAHTASYEASEKNKEVTKKKGAGDELKKKKSAVPADLGFTADEFKIWANDLDVKEAKRIDKILVKKYGEKAVQKLADEINAGNSRTYKVVFARLSSEKPKESKKDRVVDDFLSGKDVSKQLTEKKSSRKTTKVGKGEYQTGMKVANKKLSAKEQKLVDKILDENKGELDKEYLEAFYPEVSKKVHEAVIKAQSAKSLKEKPVKKVAIKTAKSLPEIKIPEKPKLRDKNFSSKISDYNAALDYRDYREAVLRGDKKAISDAKYNLTGYLREEADSTSLTRKISKLTGILLGASRDASKSSEKTTKTKLQAKIGERKGKFIVSSSGKPLKNAVNAAIAKAKREAYIEKSPYKDVLKRYSGDALVVALQRRGVEYKKAVSISNRLQALKAQERSVEFRGK